jgi:hypothetical protein
MGSCSLQIGVALKSKPEDYYDMIVHKELEAHSTTLVKHKA